MIITPGMSRSLTSEGAKLHKLINMSEYLWHFNQTIRHFFCGINTIGTAIFHAPQFSGSTLKDHIDLAAIEFPYHWVYARNHLALVGTV